MTQTLRTFMILLLTWMMTGSNYAAEPERSFRLECPGDVTVSCTDELWDLSIYGKAYIWEHYVKRDAGPPSRVERDLNICGVGEIRRIWEVEDPNWNIVTCTQVITVGAKGGFGESDIIWPANFDTSGCTLELDPDKLPKKYSIPRFKRVECSKPGYSYKDRVFTVNGSCKKIMRTWEVIDCCSWDPDDPWGKGIWKHYQIIKLIQKDSPTILNCPKKITVDAKTCDGTFIDLDTVLAVDKCGNSLKVWHNSPYADTSRGPDATGTYPIGTTKFYYMIKYACGKVIKCPVTITVKNNLQPRVYCRNGVITTLMGMDTDGDGINDEGMVEVWAKDLDKGSAPKCKGRRLWFSFSSDTTDMSRVFTCENVGENEVQMWVTDEWGNQTYCVTKIIVQNNAARIQDCMPDSLRPKVNHLIGSIAEQNNEGMKGAHITLEDMEPKAIINAHRDTTILETRDTFIGKSGQELVRIHWDTIVVERRDTSYRYIVYTAESDAQGMYRLDSVPRERNYRLYVDRKGDPMQRVNTNDLMALLKHLSGISTFTSPYTYLAADLNGDGWVNQSDYDILLTSLLPFGRPTSHFKAWRFIERSKSIDPEQKIDYKELEQCRIQPLKENREQMDFVAVKLGDLDGQGGTFSLFREAEPVRLTVGEAIVRAGESLLPLYLDQGGANSGRIDINISGLKGARYEMVEGTATFESIYDENRQVLSLVWMDPFRHPMTMPIGYIKIKQSLSDIKEIVSYEKEGNSTYFMDGKGRVHPILLRVQTKSSFPLETIAVRIGPNPFNTNIRVFTPAGKAGLNMKVELFDMMGNSIKKWELLSANTPLKLEVPEQLAPMLYLCKIQLDGKIMTTKLVKLKKQ